MATTVNGGATWQLAPLRPAIALPRQYRKDGKIAGYGAIGQVVRGEDGYFYGHVGRTYHNNTGAGPANTAASGTCVFRTACWQARNTRYRYGATHANRSEQC